MGWFGDNKKVTPQIYFFYSPMIFKTIAMCVCVYYAEKRQDMNFLFSFWLRGYKADGDLQVSCSTVAISTAWVAS